MISYYGHSHAQTNNKQVNNSKTHKDIVIASHRCQLKEMYFGNEIFILLYNRQISSEKLRKY